MDARLAVAVGNGPFHAALRAAISHRGLTLKQLQRRLAVAGVEVGIPTLSCWQSGRRRPSGPVSLAAVHGIERELGLPPESLSALLPRPSRLTRPPAHVPGARRYAEVLDDPGSLQALLDELGRAGQRLHQVSSHTQVQLGADRGMRHLDIFHTVIALRPVDRYITVYTGEPGDDAARFRVEGLDNCRTGRMLRDQAASRTAAELLFDRRLEVGDTHIFRYRIADDNPNVCTEQYRWLQHPTVYMSMEVQFHPAALPARMWRYTRGRESGRYRTREELTLSPHHNIHIVYANGQPGCVGLEWEW